MCVDTTKCNGRGSLTPGSEPGLMDEGVGAWTDKDKTWGNGQGKDFFFFFFVYSLLVCDLWRS